MKVKKRFIAGAVCPCCGEMDKIVMFQQDDKSVRECVACGFGDAMRYEVGVNQPETRLDKTKQADKSGHTDTDTNVVRIMELGNQ